MPPSSQAHGDPRPPDAAVKRYRSIQRRLAPESGCTPAERATAETVLAKLRTKHPGIEAWAALPEVTIDFGSIPEPPPGARFHPGAPAATAARPTLRSVFDFARGVMDAVSARQRVADIAAASTRAGVRVKQDGTVRIIIDIDPRGLDTLNRVAPEATYEFAESVCSIVTAELVAFLDDA